MFVGAWHGTWNCSLCIRKGVVVDVVPATGKVVVDLQRRTAIAGSDSTIVRSRVAITVLSIIIV